MQPLLLLLCIEREREGSEISLLSSMSRINYQVNRNFIYPLAKQETAAALALAAAVMGAASKKRRVQ